MYRRPKFLEKLLEIRLEMAHEADYDVDLFAEMARTGVRRHHNKKASSQAGDVDDAKILSVASSRTL
jgi:hypothetical protein